MSPLDGTGVLVGRSVIITGPSDLGRRLAESLAARGAAVEIAPFIRVVPAAARPWREAIRRLQGGGFDWLIVMSMATVRVLTTLDLTVPQETRIAAVGPATARALVQAGFDVSLVPAEHSARGLLADPNFTSASPVRVFLPQSDTASPLLAQGLRELGHEVVAISAYRVEGVPAPPHVIQRLRQGGYDALVLGSGSVAVEVLSQVSPVSDHVRIVAVGPTTAEAAQLAGLPVAGYGVMRDPEALAEAVEAVLEDRWVPPESHGDGVQYHDHED